MRSAPMSTISRCRTAAPSRSSVILTDAYQIPPENLVTQGYGEQHPKVPTVEPSRENRRVAARRITPLLHGAVASR